MEHQGGGGKDLVPAAVDGIPQNGAADVLHVDANLMGATSFQPESHQRKGTVAGNATVHRVGEFSLGGIGDSLEALPVPGVTDQLGLDVARWSGWPPHHNGNVLLLHPPLLELLLEPGLCRKIPGSDDEAGGVLVQPMDNAGTMAGGHRFPAPVEQQGVHQGTLPVACGRMSHHALGLVHHRHVIILIHNFQRQVLGLDVVGNNFLPFHLNHIPRLHL